MKTQELKLEIKTLENKMRELKRVSRSNPQGSKEQWEAQINVPAAKIRLRAAYLALGFINKRGLHKTENIRSRANPQGDTMLQYLTDTFYVFVLEHSQVQLEKDAAKMLIKTHLQR